MFDEVGDIENDPSYALLWEVARHAQSIYKLVLVGASATISTRLIGCFSLLGAVVNCCLERQFPVRNFTISTAASCGNWKAIIHITASLFKKGNVCLVCLPRKYEIETKKDWNRLEKTRNASFFCMVKWMSEASIRPRGLLGWRVAFYQLPKWRKL